jgi:hypothetical protein
MLAPSRTRGLGQSFGRETSEVRRQFDAGELPLELESVDGSTDRLRPVK